MRLEDVALSFEVSVTTGRMGRHRERVKWGVWS